MINLTEKDMQQLKNNNPNYVYFTNLYLSTGKFYVKYCSKNEMFRELITKKIADIVEIKCPNYYIVVEANCILIEEESNIKENFYRASDLKNETITLNDIQNALVVQRDKYNRFTNVEELIIKLSIMHFIDILFSNIDRFSANYGFILNEDKSGSLVIFNHQNLLNFFDKVTRPVSFPNADALDFTRYSKKAEAEYFIEHTSKNILEIINTIFSRFTPETLYLIINSIEKEYKEKFPDKMDVLMKYYKNYRMIGKLLSKNRISKQNKGKRKNKEIQ